MEEDTGFYRVTYDAIHKEIRVFEVKQEFFGHYRNRVEVVDSSLQIYSVHVYAKNIAAGQKLGEILLKNHVGED